MWGHEIRSDGCFSCLGALETRSQGGVLGVVKPITGKANSQIVGQAVVNGGVVLADLADSSCMPACYLRGPCCLQRPCLDAGGVPVA